MAEPGRDGCIDYIELVVADIAAAKSFYGGALGWTFTDYGPDYCEFFDGRLKGGFAKGTGQGGGGPIVILYASDLEFEPRQGRGQWRAGRQADLPLSRRAAIPLLRPGGVRARHVVGGVGNLARSAHAALPERLMPSRGGS